jgi:hypothetical protein
MYGAQCIKRLTFSLNNVLVVISTGTHMQLCSVVQQRETAGCTILACVCHLLGVMATAGIP